MVVSLLLKGLAIDARAELVHFSALGLEVGIAFLMMLTILMLGQVVARIIYQA